MTLLLIATVYAVHGHKPFCGWQLLLLDILMISRSRTLPLGWWHTLSDATASRIEFKVVIPVYQALAGRAPSYLADDCCLVTDADPRRLRSAETRMLLFSQTWINFGDRVFCAAGRRAWNLRWTSDNRTRHTYISDSRWKTFLFGQWD